MPSKLLSLPAELRNKIYEMVFSAPEGLEYVKNGSASGKICLRVSRTEGTAEMDEVDGLTQAISCSRISSTSSNDSGRAAVNQLQYVCRQLRYETKCLEMFYNTTMTFTCAKTETLANFMRSLPLYAKNRPRKLLLQAPRSEWEVEMFRGLPDFCRAYPQCSLHFYHPELVTTEPLSILFTMLLVKYGARGEKSFVNKITTHPLLQRHILESLRGKIEVQLVTCIPFNVTFYPCDSFDESLFRQACVKYTTIRDVLAPTLPRGIDDLVAIAKDCYTVGF